MATPEQATPTARQAVQAGPSRIPFDPDAPLFVAQATIASAVVGATTGASMGVVKSVNPFALSMGMGINCGLAGLTFFGMREYLVSPALIIMQSEPADASLSPKARGKLPEHASASLSDVRFERVLDSAVAGVLAGGTLSGCLRGKSTIPRAAFTAGLVTSLLQLSANQFRVIRLQLLARKSKDEALQSAEAVDKTPIPKSDFDMSLRGSLENSTTTAPVDQQAQTLPGKMIRALSTFLPVWKLSDDEYLALLLKKKGEVERKLVKIQEEELRIFEEDEKRRSG